MSVIIAPPWARQPAGPVTINWGHPLARGLIFAGLPFLRQNLVSGVGLSASTAAVLATNQRSAGFEINTGALQDVIPTAAGARGSEFDLQTISAFVLARQTSATNSSLSLFRGQGSSVASGWGVGLYGGSSNGAYGVFGGATLSPGSTFATITNPTSALLTSDGASTVSLYCNGALQQTASYATATYQVNSADRRLYFGAVLQNNAASATKPFVGYIWNRCLSSVEAAEIHRNPWALFAPRRRRLWSGFAAGGVTTVAVPAGELSLSGFAPTIVNPRTVAVPAAALSLTGFAPTVTTSSTTTIEVPAGALNLTAFAPVVVAPRTVTVPSGTLTLTGFAPAVLAGTSIQVPTGALTLTGFAPAVAVTSNQLVSVPVGTIALTGFAPTVLGGQVTDAAPQQTRSGGLYRRNYIVKGKRYHNLTNEELAYLLARELVDVTRDDIKVTYKDKKPHKVSKNAWVELQETMRLFDKYDPVPWDDDEEAAMLLL